MIWSIFLSIRFCLEPQGPPVLNGWKWWFPTISQEKNWTHPTETTINKWLIFGVPGKFWCVFLSCQAANASYCLEWIFWANFPRKMCHFFERGKCASGCLKTHKKHRELRMTDLVMADSLTSWPPYPFSYCWWFRNPVNSPVDMENILFFLGFN